MEILAGIVRLDRPNLLPAPWFNRPSLGLVTNTAVRVGILKAANPTDAPPDIIVTPLQTSQLHCTASVVIDLEERAGAVHEALRHVQETFNIALAETVTIDQRSRHRITLVLEPPPNSKLRDTVGAIELYTKKIESFKADIEKIKGFKTVSSNFVVDDTTKFEKQDTSVVRYGSLNCANILSHIDGKYRSNDKLNKEYDFSRVIVSSSAEGRFIRYIFPKRGVFEITISHRDVPTALARLSSVFHELNFNILMSRLSRSVGEASAPGKSILVAICEPDQYDINVNPKEYLNDIKARIGNKLDTSDEDGDYQFSLNDPSLGAPIDRLAYPYRRGINPSVQDVFAQTELAPFLGQYKLKGNKAIFVSYTKALESKQATSSLKDLIFKNIKDCGCIPYNGWEEPQRLKDDEGADVRARMWMASAGIFFAFNKDGTGTLTPNQLIEWGYIYGQGKPWVVIVRSDQVKAVEHFMIPRRSFITYDDLETTQALEAVGNKISEAIITWFPKTTDAR